MSERFFDENEGFYSADKRNKTVFGEIDKDKKQETAVADDGKADEKESENADDGIDASNGTQDNAETELLKEFTAFKQDNPDGTLKEFYAYLAEKIKEGEDDDEKK